MKRPRGWGSTALLLAALVGCEGERQLTSPPDAPAFAAADALASMPSPDTSELATFLAPPRPGIGAHVAGATIGAEGGSVRLGDFEIVVPPGAVATPTRFSIRLPPEPARQRHAWAEFSPHGAEFAVPVILRLPFATTDAEPRAPAAWWNEKLWVPLETTVLPDGRIETHVPHFSVYGTLRLGITLAGG